MYLSLRGTEGGVFGAGWKKSSQIFFRGWEKSRIFALGL